MAHTASQQRASNAVQQRDGALNREMAGTLDTTSGACASCAHVPEPSGVLAGEWAFPPSPKQEPLRASPPPWSSTGHSLGAGRCAGVYLKDLPEHGAGRRPPGPRQEHLGEKEHHRRHCAPNMPQPRPRTSGHPPSAGVREAAGTGHLRGGGGATPTFSPGKTSRFFPSTALNLWT